MNGDFKIPEKNLIICTIATEYALENVRGEIKQRVAVSAFLAGAEMALKFVEWGNNNWGNGCYDLEHDFLEFLKQYHAIKKP